MYGALAVLATCRKVHDGKGMNFRLEGRRTMTVEPRRVGTQRGAASASHGQLSAAMMMRTTHKPYVAPETPCGIEGSNGFGCLPGKVCVCVCALRYRESQSRRLCSLG